MYPVNEGLAGLFPPMAEDEYARLVESVRANGLRYPITLWRGEVVDGRHRQRACADAGVEPRYDELADGADALAFVVDSNMSRRHLSVSQRSIIAARIANLPEGRPKTVTNVTVSGDSPPCVAGRSGGHGRRQPPAGERGEARSGEWGFGIGRGGGIGEDKRLGRPQDSRQAVVDTTRRSWSGSGRRRADACGGGGVG